MERKRRRALRGKKPGDKLVIKDMESLRECRIVNREMLEHYSGEIVTLSGIVRNSLHNPRSASIKIEEDGLEWTWYLGMIDIM